MPDPNPDFEEQLPPFPTAAEALLAAFSPSTTPQDAHNWIVTTAPEETTPIAAPANPTAEGPTVPADPYLICPHCNSTLRELQFSCVTHGREWGAAYLNATGIDEHDRNDSETDEWTDYVYTCGECDGGIDESTLPSLIQTRRAAPPGHTPNGVERLPTFFGPMGGFRFKETFTKAQRDTIEERKPDSEANETIATPYTVEQELLLRFGCECPRCHKQIQIDEDPPRSRNSQSLRITHQTCPECGHEFKLSDIKGNNHAQNY